ncbi:MAG TPA: ATPase [Clostridiales bacterium]|nr:MAG: ATPase [Clostridiales bacterium GWD2_32_59]HAN09809.1 ATPase [Clostridiales bacterium]
MFIGREKELEQLNKLYKKQDFNFIVMYGRRRVGKTTLLKEFCRDKRSIFFVSEEYNDKSALEKFSKVIKESLDEYEDNSTFNSWEDAFKYIVAKIEKEKIVLILDEFQYLVNSNKSILSLIQNLIDHSLNNKKLYIVVCSSVISFMEEKVLSGKSPLFGRKTAEFYIKPLSFHNSIKFFKNYSNEDKVLVYSILGGIPLYLNQFSDSENVEENIKENFLTEISNLYSEPKNLLNLELRSPAVYNSIIEAIATGSTKLNEISSKVGEEKDKVYNYIMNLVDMHIVEKTYPITEKVNTRKTIYKLSDNLFKFWYRFIFGNISSIEKGMSDVVYNKKIKPYLLNYVGYIFEDICIEYLVRKNVREELPITFDKIGKWWGNNSKTKQEEEIDIMATSDEGIIFGECKYKNEKVGIKELNKLKEGAELFEIQNKFYYLFSKTGFKEDLIEEEKKNKNIVLVDLNEVMQ